MSRMRRTILLWAGAFVVSASALMGEQGLEFFPPSDKKIYHEPHAGITLKLNDRNITSVVLVTDKNERHNVELTKECDNVCSKTIMLHPGENSIRAWGYVGENLAYEAKSELYHVSQVIKGYKDPPLKYKEILFHTDENEKLCTECHDMSVNEQKGIAFVDVRESNCYVCHKNVTVDKHAHAPAVNWLCTGCHTGKTGVKNKELAGKSKFIAPEPVAPTCFECHDKNKETWGAKSHKHLPVDAGRCTKCHNPHASDNPMFVRETSKSLCLECHGDKKLTSQMRGNSKCPGAEAPSCLKCHNPHASDHKYFLDPPRTHAADTPVGSEEKGGRKR